jgi:hypothetical protein
MFGGGGGKKEKKEMKKEDPAAVAPAVAKKPSSSSGSGGLGGMFGGGGKKEKKKEDPAVAMDLASLAPAPAAAPAPAPAAPAPAPAPAPAMALAADKVQSRKRWERAVKSTSDRIASVQAAAISSIGGSLVYAPVSVLYAITLGGGLNGQWEFNTDMLAIQLAVFGVTYRYAIREDRNPNLGDGVLLSFVIARALANVHVPDSCGALPLDCGPPYGYFSSSMLSEIGSNFFQSYLAYGSSKYCLDKAFSSGLLGRFDRFDED